MSIKNMLKSLRKEHSYTQKDVADFLDMSPTGYASWEQGLAEPSISAIKILCKLYDISADELLEIDNLK